MKLKKTYSGHKLFIIGDMGLIFDKNDDCVGVGKRRKEKLLFKKVLIREDCKLTFDKSVEIIYFPKEIFNKKIREMRLEL